MAKKNQAEGPTITKKQLNKMLSKEGKVTAAFLLHQRGFKPKKIAELLGINTRIVTAYIWRKANPDKYKAVLKRYFAKKKAKSQKKEHEVKS